MLTDISNYAQENNIIPIVCVGESNKNDNIDVVLKQVKSVIEGVKNNSFIIAYEPIWAIGSGEQPTASQVKLVADEIRSCLNQKGFNAPILYGGSVNLSNVNKLKESGVDGFLMGGVSLKIDEFIKIVKGE